MKKWILMCLSTLSILTFEADARDDVLRYDIAQLLQTAKAKEALDNEIALYFGEQQYSVPTAQYGVISTNKKTNAFNKSDKEACHWVMLSALKALQQRARKQGMNAVVNIVSTYKGRHFASTEQFECGAGTIMAGVALQGSAVKL